MFAGITRNLANGMDSTAGTRQTNAHSPRGKNQSTESGGKSVGDSLKLNAGLKSVLKTKLLMGDQEIEELFSQAAA